MLLLHTTREQGHYNRRGNLPQLVVFAAPHDKCPAWVHPSASSQSQWQHREMQRCSVVAPVAASSLASAQKAVAGAATKANAAKHSCGAPDVKVRGKGV